MFMIPLLLTLQILHFRSFLWSQSVTEVMYTPFSYNLSSLSLSTQLFNLVARDQKM